MSTTIDYAKAARWMKRERNEMKKYLEVQTARGMADWHRRGIEEYTSGTGHFGQAAGALDYLSNYESALGGLRVLDGDLDGFSQIDRACLYKYWMIRLILCGYDADERPDKQPRLVMEHVATCWMHATALGADSIRDWLSARVKRVDAGDGSIGGKHVNSLCTLMAHFVTGRGAKELEQSGWGAIGPFAAVALRTFSAEGYEELADYHSKHVGSAAFEPFHFFPYRTLPCELQAIERLTGVAITLPRHPLIASPLAQRRQVPDIPVTEELRAIIDKAKDEFPLCNEVHE